MKTDQGWLFIYHGYDRDHIYCLGVALLDLDNPAIVLNRPTQPILEPVELWECVGEVPNVVFTCGAVDVGEQIYVYYGGADRVIALATADKQELLNFVAHRASDCPRRGNVLWRSIN
jgi:predicted GH43/DUF377 family glycosyl hydrolase